MSDSERKGEPLAATEVVEATSSSGERRGVLLVTVGEQAGRMIPLLSSKPVSFGRSDECALSLDDKSLSRVHAEIRRGADDYILQDLCSTNGSFVNDTRVEGTRFLADGDRIRLGTTFRMRFSLMDEAEARALLDLSAADRVSTLSEGARGGPAAGGEVWKRLLGSGTVVKDARMRALYEQAAQAARATISVLLLGETGVGKEVLARAIHAASPRAGRPFLALNCAALSESLLEAELFGHEKGAFTGAASARPGLFESAEGGTVFLDEVGELPASIQVKLLRVLEERQVLRVGARQPRAIDVRFVSATNRDLEAESEQGRFRRDLFFRLDGIALTIPPLRERRDEIAELAALFAEAACDQLGRSDQPVLGEDVLDLLSRHAWPGNVRELRNVIERAVVLCSGSRLLPQHLPPRLVERVTAAARDPAPAGRAEAPALRSSVADFEKQRIVDALEQCGGNQTRAAERLGISRRTLVARLSEWGLTRSRGKPNE